MILIIDVRSFSVLNRAYRLSSNEINNNKNIVIIEKDTEKSMKLLTGEQTIFKFIALHVGV